MAEAYTYIFEPELRPPHRYELDREGLVYHPPRGVPRAVRWQDIRYLEDVSGRRVDIVVGAPATPIPLFYGTRRFSGLLEDVCDRLAGLHRDKLGIRTFRANRAYRAHRTTVLSVLAALLLGSVIYLQDHLAVWLFVLGTILPMAAYILRQPHTVTPLEDGLEMKDGLRTRFIAYGRIAAIGFALHGDTHTAYLCVRLHLTDGRRIKVQRFDNLVLLFLFMKTKWERHRSKAAGQRAAKPPEDAQGSVAH